MNQFFKIDQKITIVKTLKLMFYRLLKQSKTWKYPKLSSDFHFNIKKDS